jgi:hypothetical protein
MFSYTNYISALWYEREKYILCISLWGVRWLQKVSWDG